MLIYEYVLSMPLKIDNVWERYYLFFYENNFNHYNKKN